MRNTSIIAIAAVIAATSSAQDLGFTNTPIIPGTPWHVHDPARPYPRVVTPGTNFSQMADAPSDAEVLFDGADLSKWQNPDGSSAQWAVQNGFIEVRPGGDIRTTNRWADFQLHLEFSTPNPPTGHSQGRGNSGVLINDMYEVQILDSYQDPTYADGQCGALYGQMPPLVNACKPPGDWQTYDIIFESPRWDSLGNMIKKASVTVLQNGVVIHNKREFMGSTDGISAAVPWKTLSVYPRPHPPEVFIELQNHNSNPDRFRNIWIRNIGENP